MCRQRAPDSVSSVYVKPSNLPPRLLARMKCRVFSRDRPTEGIAVMDPTPCACWDAGGSFSGGSSAQGGKDEDNKPATGVNDRPPGGSSTKKKRTEQHYPPALWDGLGGGSVAHRPGLGPVRHGLRLKSAYAQQGDAWGTGEPAFTSFHARFKVHKDGESPCTPPVAPLVLALLTSRVSLGVAELRGPSLSRHLRSWKCSAKSHGGLLYRATAFFPTNACI